MLSREEAQALTNRIKDNFAEVGALLQSARNEKVWHVLGYSSFSDWLQFAVGISRSRAYQLINIAGIEAELRQLGAFPQDFSVSTRTSQEIINFGTSAFMSEMAADITDDPDINEDRFITRMNQIRHSQATDQTGANSNVVPLPATRDMNQHVFIALDSLTAQVADFPMPNEVENQHLEAVRSKLRDALQALEDQRRAYATLASLEVSVNA